MLQQKYVEKWLCDIHHPDIHHQWHSPPPTFTTPNVNCDIHHPRLDPIIFPDPAPEGRTETLLVTYIPKMLATNIQYKYIY